MSFRWQTPLTMEEVWLNSDREILGRASQEMGKQGILLTITLPDGVDFQAEVEKLNAESGSTFCNMAREVYDERKSSKEAASRRKQRDRQLRESVVGPEEESGAEHGAGTEPVPQTIEALQEAVAGGPSLEEDLVLRLDRAATRAAQLRGQRDELERDINAVEKEVAQLESLLEVLNASKILESASAGILVPSADGSRPDEGMDSAARSPEDEPEASEGSERGSEAPED